MKLLAPIYYKNFTCIADKCTHSCCVGWEIDVDDTALEKYNSTRHSYGKAIRDSIDYEPDPHFRLCENDRCPHLDEKGLCNIITHLGKEFLCDICTEHPRFYNDTVRGKEVGLGMACEEACRIILGSDDYMELVQIGTVDGEEQEFDFDPTPEREVILSILSDRSLDYNERLAKIYAQFTISPQIISDSQWQEVISQLEYLDPDHRKMLLAYTSDLETPKELEKYLERALAYFIYRHCTQAFDENDLKIRLGFCLFCERLLCSVAKDNLDSIECLARIISEEIEYSIDNTEKIQEQFL